MKKTLKVYIADDHTLFRKAMVNLLQTFDRISEVKDAENGKELLTLVKFDQPDIVIVDLQMPVMDGAETCEQLIHKFPDVKIVILTMHDSERYMVHMMEIGVHAFLLKNTEPDELKKAIYSVVDKDFYHNDWVASVMRKNVMSQRPKFKETDLTERELQIVRLVCQEYSNKEIAERLYVSERTIEHHRASIMKKLGLRTTIGLVHFAYEVGIMK
jgi:two-component system, NarL family, response regulator DegU